MNMTLRHLEIFRAVVQTGSFTKAADKLYITQSAVSHAIRDLEEMTETPLFDRLSRRVQVTKAGQVLLQQAQPILAGCHALTSRLKNLEASSPVHLAANITIAGFYLPRLLREFSDDHPDISVIVDVIPAAAAVDYLRTGRADLALIEGTKPQGPFAVKEIGSYNLKAVCAPAYLPQGTVLTLERLCREKLLLREPGSAIRDVLDSQLYLAGHTPHPSWCSVNSSALLEAARNGLGIAILPEAYLVEDLKKQRLVELSVPSLTLQNNMYAVWHRDQYLPQPLKMFLESCSF